MATSKPQHFMFLAILATILESAKPQGCNRTYYGLSGTITSPNYPNSYSNRLDCFYTIQSPLQNSINIKFQSFETEYSYDWLQIRCSIGLAKMSSFHGAIIPPPLSFDSCSQLILQFHSDSSNVRTGFSLNYTMGSECRQTYSGSSGTITSPNYPNNYNNNLNCFYIIQPSRQSSINITFQSFETEPIDDWLQIRCSVGSAKTSPKFQGAIIPPFLTFDSCSQLILQFNSDGSNVRTGFSLNYTIGSGIRGGFITKPTNVFFRQDPIVLHCASNAVLPSRYPWWSYSSDGITFTLLTDYSCSLAYPPTPSGVIYRTQRNSTTNACNLIIQSATTNAPVAVFTCTDSKLNDASAIVTFSDLVTPIFRTDINSSSLMEVVRDDVFNITCSLLPLRNPNQILKMQSWIYFITAEERITSGVFYNSNATLTVTAQPDMLPSYTCKIHIDVLSKLSFDIATNKPTLNTLSFTTETHPVLYWPENKGMIVTGDLNGTILSNASLRCYVPANPPATFLWRDESLGLTTTGSVIYVSHNGTYTCNATNYIRGKMYQASKTITVTVTAEAISKDVVMTLIVGVVLGTAVLILLLIVIVLCRQKKVSQASPIKRTIDEPANNEDRIFNQYDVTEMTYANQSELAMCPEEDQSCSGAKNQRDSEIYETVTN